MKDSIPTAILAAITEYARDMWKADSDLIQDTIEIEKESYLKLHRNEFPIPDDVRDIIIYESMDFSDNWEDRLAFFEEESSAYINLLQFNPMDIPTDVLENIKDNAIRVGDSYESRLSLLQDGVANYQHVRQTRARVDPIREIIMKMEEIVGNECYNASIRNYGPGGVWEGDGRSFRYPVTFLANGDQVKRWGRPDDLESEKLITGIYKFGANEISIYRALVKIVKLLEAEYGLDLDAN